jgi:propanol-preferring alcohol dehydrogenase
MKAAIVHSFDQPLALEDVPTPTAGPEQVLVRIEACGLCHTDIHAARGEWPVKPEPPFIPGHEGVGIIERVGSGNSHGLQEGMRVALPWLGYACGDCRYCNSGAETLCESQINTGYGMNGAFAEYAIGYARHVVRVPDDVDPLDAAPLTCAGVTTYKAVKVSGASSAGLVAVFGAGGLGHLAIQYARVTGAAVVAVDINEERLNTARELGAEHVVHVGEQDPIAAIQALGGADQAISTAVSPSAFEQALGSLARGGTLVCVGLPAQNEMRLPIFQTVLGGLTVKGSIVGTHHDLEEVFELHRRGRTQVERVERELDDVNEAIGQVLDGSAPAPRMVFRMDGVPHGASESARVAAPA